MTHMLLEKSQWLTQAIYLWNIINISSLVSIIGILRMQRRWSVESGNTKKYNIAWVTKRYESLL